MAESFETKAGGPPATKSRRCAYCGAPCPSVVCDGCDDLPALDSEGPERRLPSGGESGAATA